MKKIVKTNRGVAPNRPDWLAATDTKRPESAKPETFFQELLTNCVEVGEYTVDVIKALEDVQGNVVWQNALGVR